MKKVIAGGVLAVALAVPVAAFADNGQLIALYQQLIALLQQELHLIQENSLSVSPMSGSAPLAVSFTINKVQGNEALDFGDGHSTGSDGCKTNTAGFCDLTGPVMHTYNLPGTYKVTLYRTVNGNAAIVTTNTVTVK